MSVRAALAAVPRRFWLRLIVLACLAAVPFVLIAHSRATPSDRPRIQLMQDMGLQPVAKAQAWSPLFTDHRAMRPPVAGTVARTDPDPTTDPPFYRGQTGAPGHEQWLTDFPRQIQVNDRVLARGRERFAIYCAACHGDYGYGNGIASERAKKLAPAWVAPANLHSDTVKNQPNGYLFSVITNGVRTMPSYAGQIPVADRWAIIAYLRDLQSRN